MHKKDIQNTCYVIHEYHNNKQQYTKLQQSASINMTESQNISHHMTLNDGFQNFIKVAYCGNTAVQGRYRIAILWYWMITISTMDMKWYKKNSNVFFLTKVGLLVGCNIVFWYYLGLKCLYLKHVQMLNWLKTPWSMINYRMHL